MDTLRAGNEMSLDTRGVFEMVLLLVIMMIMMMMMCGTIERVFLVISTIPSIFSKYSFQFYLPRCTKFLFLLQLRNIKFCIKLR